MKGDIKMGRLEIYSENFKLNYDKFMIGCDSQEELEGWNVAEDGEMDAYYSNVLVTVILKLIAADGVFTAKEVKYFNEVFNLDYSKEELESVYDNCKEVIEVEFKDEIEEAISKLEKVNDKLANAFKSLLGLVGEIIIASDGEAAASENELMDLVRKYMD